MTDEQFDDWFHRVNLTFPAVAGWFAAKSAEEMGEVCGEWKRRTKRLTLDQCDQAAESMFLSEKRVYPKDWFQVFFSVAKRYRTADPIHEYRDGEPLSECPNRCTLDGFVFVRNYSKTAQEYHWARFEKLIAEKHENILWRPGGWAGASILAALTDDERRELVARRFPAAILCNCDRGDRADGSKPVKLPRFDPSKHQLIEYDDPKYFPISLDLPNGLREIDGTFTNDEKGTE